MLQEVKLADNEIWSVNRIYYEEYFSWKITYKMWWRNTSLKPKIDHISKLTVRDFIQFAFIVIPSWGLPKYMETKELTIRFYLR